MIQYGSARRGCLIILRQSAAIRENRVLVEKQRTDLVSLDIPRAADSADRHARVHRHSRRSLAGHGRPDVDEMLGMVNGQTNHLGRIVTDLIEVARDNLSSSKLHIETFDLGELVPSRRPWPTAPTTSRSSVTPASSAQADPATGQADHCQPSLQRRPLWGGPAEIVYSRMPGRIDIEVHDNGQGVSRKYEDVIWDRFERGENRLNAITPGSGLGLAIAKALAEAHGGAMTYRQSERLGGACFALVLPQP